MQLIVFVLITQSSFCMLGKELMISQQLSASWPELHADGAAP